MHKNAEILMEIAKEAAVSQDYFMRFEYTRHDGSMGEFMTESDLFVALRLGFKVARQQKYFKIKGFHVPEPTVMWQEYPDSRSVKISFEHSEDAQVMLKMLQELFRG